MPSAQMCPATTFRWAPYGTVGVYHDNCYDYAFDLNNPRSVNKDVPGNMSNRKAWGLDFRSCKGIAERVLADYKGLAYKLNSSASACRPGYYKVMNFVSPTGGDFHWYKQIFRVVYKTRAATVNVMGKRRPADTVQALAKFFRVPQNVIRAAYKNSKRPGSVNNGRIATNSNRELRSLNGLNEVPDPDGTLKSGRVMTIPVRLWAHKQGFGAGPVIVDASGKTIANPKRADRNYGILNYSKFCSAYCVKCGAGQVALRRARKARTAY